MYYRGRNLLRSGYLHRLIAILGTAAHHGHPTASVIAIVDAAGLRRSGMGGCTCIRYQTTSAGIVKKTSNYDALIYPKYFWNWLGSRGKAEERTLQYVTDAETDG